MGCVTHSGAPALPTAKQVTLIWNLRAPSSIISCFVGGRLVIPGMTRLA